MSETNFTYILFVVWLHLYNNWNLKNHRSKEKLAERKYKAGWSPPSATFVEPVSLSSTYNYITTGILKITGGYLNLRVTSLGFEFVPAG